jgi:hypothetical protein
MPPPPPGAMQHTRPPPQLAALVQENATSPMHLPTGTHDSAAPPAPPPPIETQHSSTAALHVAAPHEAPACGGTEPGGAGGVLVPVGGAPGRPGSVVPPLGGVDVDPLLVPLALPEPEPPDDALDDESPIPGSMAPPHAPAATAMAARMKAWTAAREARDGLWVVRGVEMFMLPSIIARPAPPRVSTASRPSGPARGGG